VVFSSIVFLFYFLPLTLALYYATGLRNTVLLACSIVFYAWGEGLFVLGLMALVGANLVAAQKLSASSGAARRRMLVVAILVNALVLVFFKYTQFLLDAAGGLAGWSAPRLGLTLPLGVSFFVFQLISYQVEVFRGRIPAERSYICLATYVMMFPHLVAGPIVRYAQVSGPLRSREMNLDIAGVGVQFFIVGLCQKVLIANTVAPAADLAFGLPFWEITTPIAWIGTAAYTLQIYFDFCGYSNMAIGLALLIGFRFPQNFNYPYAACSIREFWRRWHITLSAWFRDYVYLPLGGNRDGQLKTARNLAIVFLLTGLWHGAAWTFVAWGAYHGLFLILERSGFGRVLHALPAWLGNAYTLLVVMIGWVLFRSADMVQAVAMIKALAGWGAIGVWKPIGAWMNPEIIGAMAVGTVLSFPVIPWAMKRLNRQEFVALLPTMAMGADPLPAYRLPTFLLLAGLALSMTGLVTGTLNPFLYFRF